jgi:hypothetical protein
MTKTKKILCGIFALVIVGAISLNINVAKSSNNSSDLFLANVEALARYEITGNGYVGTCDAPWHNTCVNDLGIDFQGVFHPLN